MSDIQITPTTLDDLPEILTQARATFLEHRARIPFVFRERLYRKVERKHSDAATPQNKRLLSFTATRNGSKAGYILLYAAQDLALIYDIGVFPPARRNGTGKALLDHTKKVARQSEWKTLFAAVWDGNDASHRLFQASGFLPEKRRLATLSRKLPHLRHTSYSFSLDTPA